VFIMSIAILVVLPIVFPPCNNQKLRGYFLYVCRKAFAKLSLFGPSQVLFHSRLINVAAPRMVYDAVLWCDP